MTQPSESQPPVDTADEASRDAMAAVEAPTPRLPFPVVGIGASAGGLEAFTEFFDAMPSGRGLAFVLVQHLSPKHESMVAELLQKHTAMPVHQVEDGMEVEANNIYVIRPGHTMTMKDGLLRLGESLLKPGHSRPVDDFFRSLAEEQRERAICIILSGMGSNGTAGAQAVKVVGGMGIAQEPNSAKFTSMPRSMIDANLADFVLRPAEIPEVLLRYAGHDYVRNEPAVEMVARSESHHLGDILSILRSRVRTDFSGYKRPTIVRRIQRRMSLTQNSSIADYARLLRQTPAEIINLSDDLLIHVTGFFRDPEVWEALREKVIIPMIAEKPDQTSIRAWVTACASGEEAYTLAMLLVEAAEQADKQFDIKIFATDMAERALSHARTGIFPGGIESEISGQRLARFFDKDDSMYRVKKHLRELVVFAPQNVLQDPPFSRLDIVTCRNLLIYLEPETQQRVLSLLHFGLREGGVLVLGNSETVGERDGELFEAIDKKLRLYRRVGPTRHGMINFPDRLVNGSSGPVVVDPDKPLARASLAQATAKALLDHHSPPSVVVDRHGRIVYFHGETNLFLGQPNGEPTRELLDLAMDFVRGTTRVALYNAIETGKPAVAKDGAFLIGEDLHRVEVHVLPLAQRSLHGYFLISFVHYPVGETLMRSRSEEDGASDSVHDELRTLRDELQSTVEELQTSNEEMKASHEEVTSINEELQSSNEELETSKEELQSLNEELTTVNAQLEAKMEELERTSNDLSSLLSSTDIAVIFLDTQFRIRRFTPAVRKLMDLIPSDAGRPLSDLARKFTDPELAADAAAVLETLVPREREIAADDRWYIRRVLPYRTGDNRIAGVVVTFLDITQRRGAEIKLRDSDQRLRALLKASTEALYRMSPDWGNMTVLEGNALLSEAPRSNQSWLERYIPAEDRPGVIEVIRRAIADKSTFELEHRVRQADGSVGWTFSRAVPILDAAGELVEWFGIASDITSRKRAELSLRQSEERQAFLLKLVDSIRPLSDPAEIERTACRLIGEHLRADRAYFVTIDETTGDARVRGDYFGGGSPSLAGRHRVAEFGWVMPRIRRGDVVVVADSTTSPDGDPQAMAAARIGACVYAPLVKGGRLVGVLCVTEPGPRQWTAPEADLVREAAERIWAAIEPAGAEVALRDSKARYAALMANLPHGAAFVVDADLRYVVAEGEALAAAGLKSSDFVGKALAEALPPDLAAEYEPHFRTALGGGTFRHEHAAHGRVFITHGGPLRDADGRVYAAMAVSYDITDRKQAEAERAKLLEAEQHARTAAETANASKDLFLANLSHELRTPLSAMLLWSKVLREQPDPKTIAEGLKSIEQSANAQQKLIDDLLDSARIATGKLSLELQPVDLGRVVLDAVAALGPTADAKDVNVSTDVGESVGIVMADAARLQQVVWNLLSNAVKFTPAGGRVEVGVWRREKTVEIRVSDTGQGIDAELLPLIFGRFQQGDPGRTRRHGGLGLGLSISRQIVELHGGTITAASDGPRQGSVFTVLLPLPKTKPTARGSGAKADLAGVRVVLVEDDAQLRDVVTVLLQRAGASVTGFDAADPAMAALIAGPADLLLSDIGLPDKDGFALIRELREAEKPGTRMPAIAFTAFNRPRDRAHAIECGFDEHLAKPVDPAKMIQTIRSLLRR